MEQTNHKQRDAQDYVNSRIMPIFAKALKETSKNPMTVGSAVDPTIKYCLYQPHNYRLYFDFDRTKFLDKNPTKKATKPIFPVEHKIINQTEHTFNTILGCRITVKKTCIEIINKVDLKRWYKIPFEERKIKIAFKEVINKKDEECRLALKKFMEFYGGESKFKIINRRSEDKIMNEDKIDLVPIKQHWHNEVVKKVYDEKNVEFSNPAFASNYLRTRAVEDKAETIMEVLNAMSKNLAYVAENYKSHAGLVKQLYKLTANLNKRITQTRLNEFFK